MKAYFAIFILVFSGGLMANIQDRYDLLAKFDQEIFVKTLKMCEGDLAESSSKKSTVWLDSAYEASIFVNLIEGELPEFKVSSSFQAMIDSQGYYLALDKCYGDSKFDKDLFFFTLLSLDISGKFSSYAAELGLVKLVYGAVKRAASRAGTLKGSFFKNLKKGWQKSRNQKTNTLGLRISEFAFANQFHFGGIILASVGQSISRFFDINNDNAHKEFESRRDELTELNQDLENLEQQLLNDLESDEREAFEFSLELLKEEIEIKSGVLKQNECQLGICENY
ncbi:MAG: hypothetical protein CME67_03295 [Halobacteriovoraceae bacterium]|nr:hypothetical protein [Halobacteriovoraceae bacterium]